MAVLPLTDATNQGECAAGLSFADSLMTRLASQPCLVVRPLSAVRRLPGDATEPLRAARHLQVESLVEGNLQQHDGRLQVELRVWDADLRKAVWSQRFEGADSELFALEDAAAEALLRQLLPADRRVSPMPAMALRHADPAVRAHLLRSRFLWNQWTPSNWHKAISEARAALALDPDNAQARYWWGVSLVALSITGQVPVAENIRHARALIQASARLDAELDLPFEGLAAIALFHDWDPETAQHLLIRAIQANPGNATARDLFACALSASGKVDAAIREAFGALEIDPLSALVGVDVGYMFALGGRHAEAIEAFGKVLALYPLFAHARLYLSMSLAFSGLGDEAVAEARQALADAGRDPLISHELGLALVAAGRRREAETILAAMQRRAADDFIDAFAPMVLSARLGDLDQAMDWLDRSIEQGSRALCYIRVDPLFDPLRAVPGFADRLTRVFSPTFPAVVGTGDARASDVRRYGSADRDRGRTPAVR
ncbi:MAG: hypothetical protein M0Q42_01705 [Xanthomonadales bacterium]|nr:hypothetical protein [Xanthomonadales bacterium]